MKIKSFLLTIVAVALISNPCFADPVDSLFNVVTWSEIDGGNGHTYAILKMTITWDSSRVIVPTLTMDTMSGYLATATSQEENDFILDNVVIGAGVQPVIAQQFFLGGEEQSSIWGWLSGETFNFTNWAPGEPNNGVGIETALSMWGFEESGQPAGKWNNTLPNLEVNPYIRQWSVVEWGDPDTIQGSGDTLVNIVTWNEAEGGNGHTYALLKMTITWDSARVIAPTLTMDSMAGYLATVTTQGENDFILNNVLSGAGVQPVIAQQFFLGGEEQSSVWGWLNGEPFNFINWAPGEPNNGVGIETALSMWGFEESGQPAGKWNNTLPNLEVNPYIRQWSVVEWGEPDTTQGSEDTLVNIVTWDEAEGGNGHTYALLKMTITWDSARVIVPTLTMDSMAGYLATVTTLEENDFILNNVLSGAGVQPVIAQQFFLGGEELSAVWGWLNGEPFNFINWAPGEPNNGVGIETALSMWGFEESGQPAGKWNNTLPNLEVNPYIRQWSVVEWGEPDTTKSIIEPEPVSALSAYTKIPATVEIFLGNFEGDQNLYNENTLDYGSIVINSSVTPISVVAVSSHPKFKSGVVKISVNSDDFINTYDFMWGMTIESFNITAKFSDNTALSNYAIVIIKGHTAGDVNLDGGTNILDLTSLVDYLFRGGSEPLVSETSDVDNSCGTANIIDLTYYVDFLFRGGPPPVPGCPE